MSEQAINFMTPTELNEPAIGSLLEGDPLFTEAEAIRREAGIDDDQWEKTSEILEALKRHHLNTYEHSLRIGRGAWEIAAHREHHEDPGLVYLAGLLHDSGKLFIDEQLLTLPRRPDARQMATLRQHPSIGFYYLKNLPFDREIPLVAAWHHLFPPEGEEFGYGISVDSDEARDLTVNRPQIEERAISISKLILPIDCIDAALHRTDRHGHSFGAAGLTNLEHQKQRFVNDRDRVSWLLEHHILQAD